MLDTKTIYKIAKFWHKQVSVADNQTPYTNLSFIQQPYKDRIAEISKLCSLMNLISSKYNLPSSLKVIRSRTIRKIERLSDSLCSFMKHVNGPARHVQNVLSIQEIMGELRSLEEIYHESFHYDPRSTKLSCVTAPITLKDIKLGCFRIELILSKLNEGTDHFLKAVALEPNPSFEGYNHPHVNDAMVCTGEAADPIHNAVRDGRATDLFTIVNSLLNTYNPNSPYHSMEEWHSTGYECQTCGHMLNEDETCTCDSCNELYCDDHIFYCDSCEASYCSECHTTYRCSVCKDIICSSSSILCDSCGSEVCDDCLTKCEECSEASCMNCISDELCKSCREQREESVCE